MPETAFAQVSAAAEPAKSDVSPEQLAAAQLEEKKKALKAELAELEKGTSDKVKTLEERVFALESLVATLAGHAQPTPPAA